MGLLHVTGKSDLAHKKDGKGPSVLTSVVGQSACENHTFRSLFKFLFIYARIYVCHLWCPALSIPASQAGRGLPSITAHSPLPRSGAASLSFPSPHIVTGMWLILSPKPPPCSPLRLSLPGRWA